MACRKGSGGGSVLFSRVERKTGDAILGVLLPLAGEGPKRSDTFLQVEHRLGGFLWWNNSPRFNQLPQQIKCLPDRREERGKTDSVLIVFSERE
ncbi:hypothetical protein K0M31_019069 [Melipona bicolor]|uniref:Uncharacterized protein n=1 Tax=Melipona bicolor TaxID=60889 RepID=A0AA40KDJ1_9HYME|nr:hypothetical protein K0M31_019069 [Melipona bicolor]